MWRNQQTIGLLLCCSRHEKEKDENKVLDVINLGIQRRKIFRLAFSRLNDVAISGKSAFGVGNQKYRVSQSADGKENIFIGIRNVCLMYGYFL